MNWLKPTVETANYRHILAIVKFENFDEDYKEIHILTFDGIRNRWKDENGGIGMIKLSNILYYIPIPELPS